MDIKSKEDLPIVEIDSRCAGRIVSGHAWIYANEAHPSTVPQECGVWCRFSCKGRMAGVGYVNRHSLIIGRVVTREIVDDIELLLRNHLRDALQRRFEMLDRGAVRLVFSEADRLPGLVVDWYGGVAVVQSSTAGIDRMLPVLERTLGPLCKEILGVHLDALIIRADVAIRRLERIGEFKRVVFGDEAALTLGTACEDGLAMAANFIGGQKTGFFIDQRDNRASMETRLRRLVSPRVLDLCCYSGAWGIRALRAGAAHVVFVDCSEEALELARLSVKRNGFDLRRVSFVPGDVFDFLQGDRDRWDVVIADPPAFVKSRGNLARAKKAYEKLNRLCWRRLNRGGILYTSSCSHLVSRQDFVSVVQAAVAKEGGCGHIIYHGMQGADHPVLLAMPETEYLKCLGVMKIA